MQGAPVELSAEQRAAKQRRERLQRELEEGQRVAERAQRGASRRRWRRRLPVALVLLLVVSLVVWRQGDTSGSRSPDGAAPAVEDHSDELVFSGTVIQRPPPGVEAAPRPLSGPVPVAVPSGQFRFREVQPGTADPVAYDPCRPIHVVVNARTAPPGGDVLVNEALKMVTDASGLQFRVDGPTDEVPSENRLPYLADRHPGRWAPVLVAWSDPKETRRLDGDVSGLGGSFGLQVGQRQVYVSGSVMLDGPQLKEIIEQPDGRDAARTVIAHELAHLVGLDHVPDPTQVMHPSGTKVSTFGAGDLTALSRAGQGACFPEV